MLINNQKKISKSFRFFNINGIMLVSSYLVGVSDKMECLSGGGVLVAGLEGVCETSLGETDSSGVKWRKLGRTGEGSLGE